MIQLAIIGTNWITEKFVEAAHLSEQFQLTAVYSRHLSVAQEFAIKFDVTCCYDSLSALAEDESIDAVYIASPNSLHCAQSMQMMAVGKHVICEKPLGSNLTEVEALYRCAKQHNVVLFEAFKTDYLPNMQIVKSSLPRLGRVRKVALNYCQYSSRYQKYLNGDNPNTFNTAFSNGSIMDIGYYCVAVAASLFSAPLRIQANAQLLPSGVDGHGSVYLQYDGFDIVIQHSKVSDSGIHSEIQGEEGTLIIEHVSEMSKVWWKPRSEEASIISVAQHDNSMRYEAEHFAKQIHDQSMDQEAVQRSRITNHIITEVRRQTDVVFPADQLIDDLINAE